MAMRATTVYLFIINYCELLLLYHTRNVFIALLLIEYWQLFQEQLKQEQIKCTPRPILHIVITTANQLILCIRRQRVVKACE